MRKGDFVIYKGNSISKYLTEGKKYQLTCPPSFGKKKNRVAIINDIGLRMNTLKEYFYGL
tara:strand:- start:460 stop:639 length:180 start_codon:yes stop_codon:yes gene_type:complete